LAAAAADGSGFGKGREKAEVHWENQGKTMGKHRGYEEKWKKRENHGKLSFTLW
jgi:hypothetical protein